VCLAVAAEFCTQSVPFVVLERIMLCGVVGEQYARSLRQGHVTFGGFINVAIDVGPGCGVALAIWADLGRGVRCKMHEMLLGAIATASMVAALFFLRFWKSTRDRFFLYFAMSFCIEGCNRVLLELMGGLREDAPAYYLIRLVAYGLILIAILDKNRLGRKSK
jgi:Family of unknown function (DUF5985)